jgi:hypothetical protein
MTKPDLIKLIEKVRLEAIRHYKNSKLKLEEADDKTDGVNYMANKLREEV